MLSLSGLLGEFEVAVESYPTGRADDPQELIGGDGVLKQVEPAQESDAELTVAHHVVADRSQGH